METTRILVKNQIVTPLPFKIDKYSDTTDFKDIVICQKVDYPETYYIEKYENDFIGSSMIDITKCREGDTASYNTVRVVHDISFYHYELGSNETYDNMKPVSVFSVIETATGSPIYNAIIGNKTTFENSYKKAFGSYTHCTDDSLNKYYNKTSKCFDFSNLKITAEFNKYATYFTIVDTTTGKTISSMTINQRYQTLFNTVVVNGVLTSTVNSPLQHYFDYCSDIAVSNSKTYFQFGLIITDINPLYINGGNLKFVSASTMKDLLHGNLLLKGVRINKDFIINMKVVDKTLQPDIDDQSDITKKKQLTDSAEVEKEIEDEYINCGSKDIDPEDIAVYVEIDKDNLYPLDISINDGKVKIKDTYFAADRNLYLGSKRQFLYKQMYIDHRSNILKLDGTFRTGWNKDKYLLFKNGYLVNRAIYWVRVSDMENIYGDKLIFSASSFKPGDRIDLFYIESRDDMDLVPYNRDVYMSSKVVTSYKNNQKVVKVPYPNKVYPRGQKQFFIFTKDGIFLDNRYDYTLSDDKEYVSFKKDVLTNTGDFVTFVFPYVRSDFEVDGEYEDALSGEKAGTKFFFSYSVLDLPNRKLFLDIFINSRLTVKPTKVNLTPKYIYGTLDIIKSEYNKLIDSRLTVKALKVNLTPKYIDGTVNINKIEYNKLFDSKVTVKPNYSLREYYKKIANHKTITSLPKENADYIKEALPNVTDCYDMMGKYSLFENQRDGCGALTSIDTTGWDTSNVTNMNGMFSSCNSLTTLDVSKFDTGKVTYMNYMFGGCTKLTTLNVSKWDTSNVTDMNSMFADCSRLTTLNVSKWDTSNVIDMRGMFYDCYSLTSLDVSKWNTSKVTNMDNVFINCYTLKTLDVSNWDTSNVTNMSGMFEYCKALTTLDVSKFNTSKVTDMGDMFDGCNSLTSLDVSKFNTSNVKYMDRMFWNCNTLTSLDVSKWDTSKVTDMFGMFRSCKALTTLDVSKWNTSKVTDMRLMFSDCKSLTSLDASKWDTSKVTNMNGMFGECYNLTNLDVSKWNTSNVTSMVQMFNRCDKLTTIDISNWDTSKVKYFGMMFNNPNLTTIKGVIDMKSADKTFWNTDAVDLSKRDTNQRMFEKCTKLRGVKIKNPPADFETYSGLNSSQYTIVS